MKKKILIVIILLSLFIVISYKYYAYLKIKNAEINIVLVDNLTLEFNDKKRVSDYIKSINGTIVDDYIIDSNEVGVKEVQFNYINDDGIKMNQSYKIEVIDSLKPIIWLDRTYKIQKGKEFNSNKILCGDNYDDKPKCFIEGFYDTNKIGNYNLTYKAIDNSGNIAKKNFILSVYESTSKSNNKKKTYTKFTDVKEKYKRNNNKIGIDISVWQGDIDFRKIKESGVEFVFIRVGYSKGTNGEYVLDNKFLQNIKGAQLYDIPVGIYFYSYADSEEHAINDAHWVIEQIKDYDIELPIAFDWEDWNNFNQYNISFYKLSKIADTFISEIEKNGYKGMLYSSKAYLEKIWFPTSNDIWLAHYTDKTNYKGNYQYWQMCSNGIIDGINGEVDIDIMYE